MRIRADPEHCTRAGAGQNRPAPQHFLRVLFNQKKLKQQHVTCKFLPKHGSCLSYTRVISLLTEWIWQNLSGYDRIRKSSVSFQIFNVKKISVSHHVIIQVLYCTCSLICLLAKSCFFCLQLEHSDSVHSYCFFCLQLEHSDSVHSSCFWNSFFCLGSNNTRH